MEGRNESVRLLGFIRFMFGGMAVSEFDTCFFGGGVQAAMCLRRQKTVVTQRP